MSIAMTCSAQKWTQRVARDVAANERIEIFFFLFHQMCNQFVPQLEAPPPASFGAVSDRQINRV